MHYLRKLTGERARRKGLVGRPTLRAPELLEPRRLMAGVPFGAIANDTAEYMLGDVYVNVVLLESNGAIDQNRENWTPQLINSVKQKINEGMQWWEDTLLNAFPKSSGMLDFTVDYTYADNPVSTGYEPIGRPSDDFSLWIYDFFNQVGFNQTGDFSLDIKAFNHSQRVAHDADWSFTIFVVNDTADVDHQFHPSGTFDRSFAYSGGRFEVVLASRPASSFSHETGHIFWAKDEYFGGSSWTERRGYYNTLNVNASDNTTPGFAQVPSIMTSGSVLDQAYANHTSAVSTLEMVGWKDSDGDGIFDVLDVPHSLSGVGYFDVQTNKYRFIGESSVRTLPNLNSDSTSLRNDITINEIGRAEYRIDAGEWQTAVVYNAYSASLDLAIGPLTAGDPVIDIRTIDPRTGVASAIFTGTTARPTSVVHAGINGFVWHDEDGDGVFDKHERGIAGRTVRLVDGDDQSINLAKTLEPDNYSSGTNVGSVLTNTSLSAVGANAFSSIVTSRTSATAATGTRVFSNNNTQDSWTGLRQLKMEFANPVTSVSIDAVGNGPGVDYGRLELYDSKNILLARYTTKALSAGRIETMSLGRPTTEIAYALAFGHVTSGIILDNLRIGPPASTTTDSLGRFSMEHLPPGNYRVQTSLGTGWSATNPSGSTSSVTLLNGQALADVDFGQRFVPSPWQNPVNPYDVDNDAVVSPLDVLVVINEINARGSRELPNPPVGTEVPPPFFDVNGDGFIAPLDALLVIDHINVGGNGDGEGRSIASIVPLTNGAKKADGEGERTSPAAVTLTLYGLPAVNVHAASPWSTLVGETSETDLAAVDSVFADWNAGDVAISTPVSSRDGSSTESRVSSARSRLRQDAMRRQLACDVWSTELQQDQPLS